MRTRAFDRIRAYAWGLGLLAATWVSGCNRDPLGSGDACTRSSECKVGLVCVEGACTGSLAGLENPGTVPMVMMGGEEMPMEGADGAAPSEPPSDPGTMGGMPDAGPAQP